MYSTVIDRVFPVFLLAAGLVRFNLISTGYLVFFLSYFLWPPLTRSFPKLPSGSLRSGRWSARGSFFLSVTLYTVAVCMAQVAYHLLPAGKDSSTAKLFGFHAFTDAGSSVRMVVPDAVMLLVALVCMLITKRISPTEVAEPLRVTSFFLKFGSFLTMLVVGIASPSIPGALFFIGLLIYLAFWSFYPERLGVGLPSVPRPLVYFVAVHIFFLYVYQLSPVKTGMSQSTADKLGLFVAGDGKKATVPKYFAFIAEIVLLVVLSQFDAARRSIEENASRDKLRAKHEKAAMEQRQRNIERQRQAVKELEREMGMAISNEDSKVGDMVNDAGDMDDSGSTETITSPYSRSEQIRQFLHRGIRYHGRFVCNITLFVSGMLSPSWLSTGLLAFFCIGVALPRPKFNRLLPGVILFLVMLNSLQYIFAIPTLLPSNSRLDAVGLGKHAPLPVYYLVVSFFPLVFFAGYGRLVNISGVTLTFDNLMSAAATGDLQMLGQAVTRNSPLLKYKNSLGQSVTHVAAMNGHARCVVALLEEAKMSPLDKDVNGNTPLHYAYLNGYDLVVYAVCHSSIVRTFPIAALRDVRNNDGLAYFEMQRTTSALVWVVLRRINQMLESLVLRQADKISLVALFLVCMDRVDILHLGYLAFFIIFFVSPSLARRGWFLLMTYSSLVFLALFGWSVFLEDSKSGGANVHWASSVGLVKVNNVWKDLFLYYAVVVFAAVQLHVYRWLDGDVKSIHSQLRAVSVFESNLLSKAINSLNELFASYSTLLSYVALVLVAFFHKVSVVKFGYLVVFVVCMLVHQYTRGRGALRRIWFVVVLYTSLALVALYSYQFDAVGKWLNRKYPKSWNSKIRLEDWGFIRLEGGQSLLRHLAAHVIVFAVTAVTLRVLQDEAKKEQQNNLQRSELENPLLSDGIAMDDVAPVGSSKKAAEPSLSTRITSAVHAWWLWVLAQYYSLVDIAKMTFAHHAAHVAVIFVWLTVSTIDTASIAGLVFLLLVLAMLPFSNGRSLWSAGSIYASVYLLARYMFQFPGIVAKASNDTRWFGLVNFHDQLYARLWGDTVVLVLFTLQRVSQRDWAGASGVGGASVVPRPVLGDADEEEEDDDGYRDVPDSDENLKDYNFTADLPVGSSRLTIMQTFKVLIITCYRQGKAFAGEAYSKFGVQIALGFLLLTAFARSNVLSLFYVCVVAGLYLFRGRMALSRIWTLVVTILLVSLILQYAFAMGPPPGHKFPWHTMEPSDMRWLMIGGFHSSDLNWDFFALLLAVIQSSHFKGSARDNARKQNEQALGIAGSGANVHMADEPVYGDPKAWYNTMFSDLLFYFFVASDKVILLFILLAGTLHADVLSFGYVVLAMLLLQRKDLYLGDPDGDLSLFERHVEYWRRLHRYNFLVLFLLIVYQCPWIPNEYYDSPIVQWERLVGLTQFTADPSGNIATAAIKEGGALHSVLVFVFIDLQLMVFNSEGYQDVVLYYEENRRQAQFRGPASAQRRKQARVMQLGKVMASRRQFTAKLHELTRRIADIVRTSHLKDPFEDHEVWPTPWPEDQGPDNLLSDQQDQFEERALEHFKQNLHMRDDTDNAVAQAAKDQQESMEEDENSLQGDDDGILADLEELQKQLKNRVEDEEDEEGWVAHQWANFKLALRFVLITRIDTTLWMNKVYDPKTQLYVDKQESLESLSTVTLCRRFVTSHSQMVCFFVYLINLYEYASLIAMLVPFLIFMFAVIEVPRAPRGFWVFALNYSAMSVCVKFLFQIDAFCVNAENRDYSFQPSPYCTPSTSGYNQDHEVARDFVVGIHKVPSTELFAFVVWDLLCMTAVIWHRALMIYKGVWYHSEEELGDNILGRQQPYRFIKAKVAEEKEMERKYDDKKGGSKPGSSPNTPREPVASLVVKQYQEAQEGAEAWLEEGWKYAPRLVRDYYFTIIPRDKANIHVVKPGVDMYLWLFVLELMSALYILLFYAQMATTSQQSVASSVNTNLFSGAMVITLLTQMIFIIFDRVFYLYRSLRWKLVLQYVTTVYWMTAMFFVWPSRAQKLFQQNGHLRFFFILKVLYLLSSGLQLRWGYPPVERVGFQYIMRKASIIRGYVFRVYRAIPFVFELRSLLDWMSHKSALDLWEHLKLEDIYASMFLVQCDIIYRKEHPRGEVQPAYLRFFNGVLVFVLLIFIIFAPLLLFSSANPGTSANNVIGAKLELSVLGPTGEYELLSISSIHTQSIVSTDVYQQMKQDRVIADDSRKHIQNITLVYFGDDIWVISPPSLKVLQYSLYDPNIIMSMRLKYSFTRPGPPDAKTIDHFVTVEISQHQQEHLASLVNGTATVPLFIQDLVPKYVRLPATGAPIVLTNQREDSYLRITRGQPGSAANGQAWWELFSKGESGPSKSGVTFITISNPVFSNPLGNTFVYSVVGLYSIVVLTVGRFVRLFFAGLMQLIPYEDLHDVDDLIRFCEGVYIARYTAQYMKEEKLYRRLIKIFRTPALLAHITRRRDEDAARQ